MLTLKLCLAAGESHASSTMTENMPQLMEKLLVAAAACHGRSLEQYQAFEASVHDLTVGAFCPHEARPCSPPQSHEGPALPDLRPHRQHCAKVTAVRSNTRDEKKKMALVMRATQQAAIGQN